MKNKTTAKYKKNDIIFIEWVDSCGQSGWVESGDLGGEISHCETVGFFVNDDKEGITLALNRTTHENHKPYGELISIPQIAIKKIKKLNK